MSTNEGATPKIPGVFVEQLMTGDKHALTAGYLNLEDTTDLNACFKNQEWMEVFRTYRELMKAGTGSVSIPANVAFKAFDDPLFEGYIGEWTTPPGIAGRALPGFLAATMIEKCIHIFEGMFTHALREDVGESLASPETRYRAWALYHSTHKLLSKNHTEVKNRKPVMKVTYRNLNDEGPKSLGRNAERAAEQLKVLHQQDMKFTDSKRKGFESSDEKDSWPPTMRRTDASRVRVKGLDELQEIAWARNNSIQADGSLVVRKPVEERRVQPMEGKATGEFLQYWSKDLTLRYGRDHNEQSLGIEAIAASQLGVILSDESTESHAAKTGGGKIPGECSDSVDSSDSSLVDQETLMPKVSLDGPHTTPNLKDALSFVDLQRRLNLVSCRAPTHQAAWDRLGMVEKGLPGGIEEDFIPLQVWQQIAVCWMLEQELSIVRGGFLADDPGAGKTSTALGLIYQSAREQMAQGRSDCKPTLVIVPLGLLSVWFEEFIKFFRHSLQLRIAHRSTLINNKYGASHISWEEVQAKSKTKDIQNARLVILTTYETATGQLKNITPKPGRDVDPKTVKQVYSNKLSNTFARVITDEAHNVKGIDTLRNTFMSTLAKETKLWFISATPTINKTSDMRGFLTIIWDKDWLELARDDQWMQPHKDNSGMYHDAYLSMLEDIKST